MDQSKAPATFDLELGALAGLTSAANKVPYFTGSGAAAVTDLTAFARTVIDDADAATARATLAAVGVWTSASDPTNGDDTGDGVHVGDIWINTATRNEFRCIVNTLAGAVWRHIPRVWQSGDDLSHTGDTNETKLASVSIAANAMGANGRLEIETVWTNNNSGNAKQRRIRFGAADDLTGTAVHDVSPTTNLGHTQLQSIQNANATNAQNCLVVGTTATPYGANAAGPTTAAIDTTAVSYVVFSMQLANGGDTGTLLHYRVTLTRPDIA